MMVLVECMVDTDKPDQWGVWRTMEQVREGNYRVLNLDDPRDLEANDIAVGAVTDDGAGNVERV